MTVLIPPSLQSYTGGTSRVSVSGKTLAELMEVLDSRFPGIRFRVVDEQDRIRPHIKFFVDGGLVPGIDHTVGPEAEVQIICALSGG